MGFCPSDDIASKRSTLWYATASNAALTISALPDEPVNPTMVPLASDLQCGAPSPVNAGTKYTPLLSLMLAANV